MKSGNTWEPIFERYVWHCYKDESRLACKRQERECLDGITLRLAYIIRSASSCTASRVGRPYISFTLRSQRETTSANVHASITEYRLMSCFRIACFSVAGSYPFLGFFQNSPTFFFFFLPNYTATTPGSPSDAPKGLKANASFAVDYTPLCVKKLSERVRSSSFLCVHVRQSLLPSYVGPHILKKRKMVRAALDGWDTGLWDFVGSCVTIRAGPQPVPQPCHFVLLPRCRSKISRSLAAIRGMVATGTEFIS